MRHRWSLNTTGRSTSWFRGRIASPHLMLIHAPSCGSTARVKGHSTARSLSAPSMGMASCSCSYGGRAPSTPFAYPGWSATGDGVGQRQARAPGTLVALLPRVAVQPSWTKACCVLDGQTGKEHTGGASAAPAMLVRLPVKGASTRATTTGPLRSPGRNKVRMLSTNSLGERITASPAVAGNDLFYRTDSHLYCIGRLTR